MKAIQYKNRTELLLGLSDMNFKKFGNLTSVMETWFKIWYFVLCLRASLLLSPETYSYWRLLNSIEIEKQSTRVFIIEFSKCIENQLCWSLFFNDFVRLWHLTLSDLKKQSSRAALQKKCSLRFLKTHRKTPVPESLFQ